jgi:hypothetical protein
VSEKLEGLDFLREFIGLLLWTGQLSDERPASAIVIAPPGSGKTSILESIGCDTAVFVGDLTARPLSTIVRHSEKVTHVLLGDMLSMFGHKSATVKLTMRLVSQMTGESIVHDPWTGEAIQPRQFGLITAIPPDDLAKHKEHITGGGFASRFLLIRYSYKPSTIAKIHRFIAANNYATTNWKPVAVESGKLLVTISKDLSDEIKDFSRSLDRDPLGFRAHRHLRALVKAAARRDHRATAARRDLELVSSYVDFFSAEGREV